MSNVLGGGAKFHLMKYKCAVVVDGKVMLRVTAAGKSNKACGGRYKGQFNAKDFGEYRKSNPEWLCKKCVAVFDQLIAESKKLKGDL